MIDIYILLTILVFAVTGVVIYAIADRRRQKPNQSLHDIQPQQRYAYSPAVTIVETNSGFNEGLIAGAMYAQRPVVNETVIVQDDPSAAVPFSGFSGGDSGGGGATSDWSASDTSSSCDVSSSDSGSCDTGSGIER